LYRDHAERVLGWCIRLGGPRLDPEDLAQQVFETALLRIGGFRGDCALSTWLFGIARNHVRNARRRAALRRLVGLDALPEPRAEGPSADDEVERRRLRRRVQQALERLPAKSREVLVLADLEQRPAPEVADLLGVPAGTVYSRLFSARRAFAVALEREGLACGENVVPLRRTP
jgi:RNA polymerase sigma-70 factor (ECF subfamily)